MASRCLDDLDKNFSAIACEHLAKCKSAGLNVVVTCTYRSEDEQNALYLQGRSQTGEIITNAKGGESAHNCTLDGKPSARAYDIAILNQDGTSCDWDANDTNWLLAQSLGRSVGLVCGADWPIALRDGPHFEMPNWRIP